MRKQEESGAAKSENQSCGHPKSAIVGDRDGTNYCGMCEAKAEAQPREWTWKELTSDLFIIRNGGGTILGRVTTEKEAIRLTEEFNGYL